MQSIDNDLIEHMSNPNNYGRIDEPDAIGVGENPENGEKVIIYLRVDESGREFIIEDIKFEAIACMTTVVAGSIITSEAKEIDLDMAEELVAVTLGMLEGVPPEMAACSELVAVALKAAVDGYRSSIKSGKKKTFIYKIEQSCSPEFEHNMEKEEI